MTGLSIVIPAWNEETRLAGTLDRYLPALESRGTPFEVIVVVDGDRDRTAEVARRYASRGVRVLQYSDKLGKGGAVLAGLHATRHEYVGYLDADGPVPPGQTLSMVSSLRECDGVIASRWTRGSEVVRAEPWMNRGLGRIWNFLSRSLLFLPYRDTQCGAKFFRRAVVLRVLGAVALTNRAFDVDLLYHVRKSGGTVREVPVRWTHDPASRMPIGRAVPIMFLSLVGIRVMNLPWARHVPRRWVESFQRKWGNV